MFSGWFNFNIVLPAHTGPYNVGVTEVMCGKSQAGTVMRIYYPTRPSKKLDHKDKTNWLPEPINDYADGIIDFTKSTLPGGAPSRAIFSFMLRHVVMQAYPDAPLVEPNDYDDISSFNLQRLRVLVYSHGLGGNRAVVSVTYCDLASYGYVVASIEHRDYSASHSYYYAENESDSALKYVPVLHKEMSIDDFPKRNEQVDIRAQEAMQAVDVLQKLNSAIPVNNLIENSSFDLDQFKDRLDLSSLAVFGHSFGSATTVTALAKDKRFKCGICLDGWLFPVSEDVYEEIDQPVLFVNSYSFQWARNIRRIQRILDGKNGKNCRMVTLKETGHLSQTDLAHLLPYMLAKYVPPFGTASPLKILAVNNKLCFDFLEAHLGGQEKRSYRVNLDVSQFILEGSNVDTSKN